ncbi:hypothetical protein BREU_2348 [Bifidobacterium reuteri DSM 23975]|uniref:Uncharacterized protein n=1 Tax=Bifidobacterium reuteri DSM 23975 TaxID=1437610 RepID=A0A087CEI3_9BIFI|nr:hypothetical protein BREU_2348 [Bifidobacterium reuteri DSM 23975]
MSVIEAATMEIENHGKHVSMPCSRTVYVEPMKLMTTVWQVCEHLDIPRLVLEHQPLGVPIVTEVRVRVKQLPYFIADHDDPLSIASYLPLYG